MNHFINKIYDDYYYSDNRSRGIAHVNGFTLLEVLIAMSLLIIILLTLLDWQLKGIRYSQQTFSQTIAMEELLSIAEQWQINKNLNLQEQNIAELPDAKFTKIWQAGSYIFQLTWKESGDFLWQCSSNKQKNSACIELKILS